MNTPYGYPQSQTTYVPKTAINELDSFMSGLTDEDRGLLFSSPEFGGLYGEITNRFMFYLLQGDVGTEFINSSPQRRELAERLKIMAHNIYAENKKSTMSELERLQKENDRLQAKLKGKEGGNVSK